MTVSVPEASNQGIPPRTAKAFPRSARLLRHADFQRVYKQGKRHFSASMTVFYLRRPEMAQSAKSASASGLRIGFTVGRALGGAVQRNRMKRRLREAVRLTRPWPGASADVVINPKKLLLTIGFEAIVNELRQAFLVLERKLASKPAGETGPETKGPGSRTPEA